MKKSRICRVGSMIAIDQGREISLFTLEEFAHWRQVLMPELTNLEKARFAAAVGYGMGRDGPTLGVWERQFCERIGFIDTIGLRDTSLDFSDEDARHYLDSFLQVYLLKHDQTISVETAYAVFPQDEPLYEVPDEAMTLITITIHNSRTVVDRILNRKGEVDREIKILEPAICRLVGTGQEFLLKSGIWHLFSSDGITELDDKEAEDFIWEQRSDARYRIERIDWADDLEDEWEDDADQDRGQTS